MIHNIEPIYDAGSRVLILGSFPSVKSREGQFFYHHPQNRFWKVIAGLFGEVVPETIEEKKCLLQRNHIAVWDGIQSCDICGSSDSSIKNVVPNDLSRILKTAPVQCIFTNGKKSDQLYKKYCEKVIGQKSICLPSTSPANAAWSMERLTEAWRPVAAATAQKCDPADICGQAAGKCDPADGCDYAAGKNEWREL